MNAIAAGAGRPRPERAWGEARQSGARERNRPVFIPTPKPPVFYEFNHLRELVRIEHTDPVR